MRNIKPVSNWRWVLRKAWSVRLAVVAGLFSALEVVIPLFESSMPRGLFALASGVTTMGAIIARFVIQDHD